MALVVRKQRLDENIRGLQPSEFVSPAIQNGTDSRSVISTEG